MPIRTSTKILSQDIAVLSKDGNLTTVVGLHGSYEVASKYKGGASAKILNLPRGIVYFLILMGLCAA